jgi:hypothetical protein
MKAIKFILGLGLMVASSSVFSQGLQGIVVEKYYQADANDVANAISSGAVTPLTTSSVTYRVYVDMASGYKFNSLFGNAAHNLTVSTTTGFYNDATYGVSVNPGTISATNIRKNTAMIDSWFTTGGAAGTKAGVLKSGDTDGTVGHFNGLLANNPGGCFGLPIMGASGQDGFLPSSGTTYVVPNGLGLGTALDVLDQTNGGSIVLANGSIAALGGVQGPTSSNMVLVAQFTTNGQLSFALNLQIQNIATGVAENYVSSNPTGAELTNPTLTYVPNVAPTVSISSVTQPTGTNTNILTGTTMTLTATASDAGLGSVTGVEFFVNGTSVGAGTLSGGVYSLTNVASTPGTYVVTAKATDNDCVTTTSSSVTRTIASNVAPTVTVSAPASVIASSLTNTASVTFTAVPVDNDGVSSISQVQFFVNNTLVGTVTSAPWTYTYTASIGNGQLVKAVVTDNLTLTGTSTNASMNVVANTPPTVSITSPTAGTAFAAPTAITFTASAGDTDGTVAQVEFFVNGVSVGVDVSAPYSAIWTSTPGIKTITAKATDSNSGTTTSASLTLDISDPNALDYQVKAVTQVCNTTTFCVPIATGAAYTVDNVRGYDLVINYTAADVIPTGVVTVNNTLTTASYVEYSSAIASPGTLNLSLYFNGTAPANAEFAGQGEIFCVQFQRLGGFAPFDSSTVSVSSLQESYISGVQTKLVTPRKMYSITQDNYEADLQYWNGNGPIAYNAAVPSSFLITNIQGVLANGTATSVAPVVPNLLGSFTHVLNAMVDPDGTGPLPAVRTAVPNISIKRDILNTSDIASQSLFSTLVGATDAALGKTILLNQQINVGTVQSPVLGNPSVYQMIALDVNMDGFVSAGDISQIQQRTVGALQEYMQAWNYSNAGVSNGQLSKDWMFIDPASLTSDPAYQISATYPSGNPISGGYWKGKVPVVPFYLPVNVTNYNADGSTCPVVNTADYQGIMLGEVSGNYADVAANGITKTNETDYILVDLGNVIVEGTKVSVPVSIVSAEPVTAFDLALGVNENTLTYVSMEDTELGSESASFYNDENKTFRHSSFNLNSFTSNSRVAYFTFETVDGKITEKDLTAELGLLNEKKTEVRFTKSADLTNNSVDIYPNPSNGMFTVMSKLDGRVDIVDVTGNLVHPGVIVKANQMIEVNMPELSAGVYFVRMFSNNSMTTERIVISE